MSSCGDQYVSTLSVLLNLKSSIARYFMQTGGTEATPIVKGSVAAPDPFHFRPPDPTPANIRTNQKSEKNNILQEFDYFFTFNK